MRRTSISGHVNASRSDGILGRSSMPKPLRPRRVPDGMRSEVHEFDAREGGTFRISLHHTSRDAIGKTSSHTDTLSRPLRRAGTGRACGRSVGVRERRSRRTRREMTMTTTLSDSGHGTDVLIEHDGILEAVNPADNEAGIRVWHWPRWPDGWKADS